MPDFSRFNFVWLNFTAADQLYLTDDTILRFMLQKLRKQKRCLFVFTVSTSIDTGIDTGERSILSIDTETQSILEALVATQRRQPSILSLTEILVLASSHLSSESRIK